MALVGTYSGNWVVRNSVAVLRIGLIPINPLGSAVPRIQAGRTEPSLQWAMKPNFGIWYNGNRVGPLRTYVPKKFLDDLFSAQIFAALMGISWQLWLHPYHGQSFFWAKAGCCAVQFEGHTL